MRSSGNVLKKCCYRSLRENRKRTAVTIVGITLATALITAVACLVVSFRASMIAYERRQNGDFHYEFQGVAQEYLKYFQNNQYVEKYALAEQIGYAMLEGSQNPDKPYLFISAIGEEAEEAFALQLAEGRMPENSSELVIGRHIRSNGLVDVKVGDTLTLSVGDRCFDGNELTQEDAYIEGEESLEHLREETYRVVGIVERPNMEIEPRIAPGYSVFTRLEEPGEGEILDVYVSYTKRGLKRAEQVNAGILGISEELYQRYYGDDNNLWYQRYGSDFSLFTEEEARQIRKVAENVKENYWLLKWELLIFSSNTMNMLYGMSAIAILIIIVTSVFCIHNSFTISLTEKMKLYGRLSSVGTTSAQQRKIVYYEALFLGLAGIPLGVFCGIAASVILVKAVGGLVEEALGIGLVFRISVSAILLATVLSMVTVFFSAYRSARRAARISPISAIRANDTVKIRRKEMRCPGFIGRLSGIGGQIAYRNLKRAKVKYRTTVISIVVSVAAFIGMSTFVQLMNQASYIYYENTEYQLRASIYQWEFYDQAVAITKLDGVQEAEIIRTARCTIDHTDIRYTEGYLRNFTLGEPDEEHEIVIHSLGEEAYKRYCDKVGVSVEEAKDKAIVLAEYYWEYQKDNGKRYVEEGKIAQFEKGDIIRGTGTAEEMEIEVLTQTEETFMYLSNHSSNNITLIVSDEWMDAQTQLSRYDNIEVCIKCDDVYRIEENIRNDMQLQHFTITNYEAQYRADRSLHLVVAIFLYGFITVVALIGVTNIFNTITTNMELRAPEFAMLRSVGMTGREFRRMIWLEGMFYGGKSLLIGVPLGILLSICFHRAFGLSISAAFRFPWMGTGTAIAAVILLLYVIMHYSMGKINRKNIIETIQNENI